MVERAAIYTWFRNVPQEKKKRHWFDRGDKTDHPDEDNATQEERCRDYARAMGYQIMTVYRDTSTELGADRPELMRLRAAIWAKRLDVVVVTHPNRIFTDPDRLARLASEARGLGVRLEFLEMPYILEE